MRTTVRLTSAAIAAVIAISCASVPAFAADITDISSGTHAEQVNGGWEVNSGSTAMKKNTGANTAFKKAVKGIKDISYKPVAVLGSQIVAGTNYAVLCEASPIRSEGSPQIVIMYIYENTAGNAEITGIHTIIGEQTAGGFSANTGRFTIKDKSNKSVYSNYKKAMNGLEGVDYSPVLYLGSQVVAGSNYMILCRSKAVYPDAASEWSLVTVYKDLKGKVTLGEIQTLELGITDN